MAFVPPSVPAALKPLLLPVAKKGVAAFIKKYRMREQADTHEQLFHAELERLSQALVGRRYLVNDTLTYADIAMALVLQGISPVAERYMPRIPGGRPIASFNQLPSRYAHLITWRDELYAQHRYPTPT